MNTQNLKIIDEDRLLTIEASAWPYLLHSDAWHHARGTVVVNIVRPSRAVVTTNHYGVTILAIIEDRPSAVEGETIGELIVSTALTEVDKACAGKQN